jgi:hypothetical protein
MMVIKAPPASVTNAETTAETTAQLSANSTMIAAQVIRFRSRRRHGSDRSPSKSLSATARSPEGRTFILWLANNFASPWNPVGDLVWF